MTQAVLVAKLRLPPGEVLVLRLVRIAQAPVELPDQQHDAQFLQPEDVLLGILPGVLLLGVLGSDAAPNAPGQGFPSAGEENALGLPPGLLQSVHLCSLRGATVTATHAA